MWRWGGVRSPMRTRGRRAWAQGSRGKEATQLWVFLAARDTKWPLPFSEIRRLRLGEEVTYPRLLGE